MSYDQGLQDQITSVRNRQLSIEDIIKERDNAREIAANLRQMLPQSMFAAKFPWEKK